MPDIHSCISLVEQAAGLQFHVPAEIGDWTYQLCNMGGELISVEGLVDRIHQPIDPGHIDPTRGHVPEAWISLQRLSALG